MGRRRFLASPRSVLTSLRFIFPWESVNQHQRAAQISSERAISDGSNLSVGQPPRGLVFRIERRGGDELLLDDEKAFLALSHGLASASGMAASHS